MRTSFEIIIAGTSCLILLDKLDLLTLFQSLNKPTFISPEVKEEFDFPFPEYIQVKQSKPDLFIKYLSLNIGKGEASSLALCEESENAIAIIDDLKARKIAKQQNINYSGTLGLLLAAYRKGIIKDMNDVIEKIQKTNFSISKKIIEILRQEINK